MDNENITGVNIDDDEHDALGSTFPSICDIKMISICNGIMCVDSFYVYTSA